MKKGEVEARALLARAQKRFQDRLADVEARLDQARGSSGSSRDEIRKGLEAAWTSLEDSLERARAEFAGEATDEDDSTEPER